MVELSKLPQPVFFPQCRIILFYHSGKPLSDTLPASVDTFWGHLLLLEITRDLLASTRLISFEMWWSVRAGSQPFKHWNIFQIGKVDSFFLNVVRGSGRGWAAKTTQAPRGWRNWRGGRGMFCRSLSRGNACGSGGVRARKNKNKNLISKVFTTWTLQESNYLILRATRMFVWYTRDACLYTSVGKCVRVRHIGRLQ